ncbi:hypothetical protein D3C76_1141490 [compost metagenome]
MIYFIFTITSSSCVGTYFLLNRSVLDLPAAAVSSLGRLPETLETVICTISSGLVKALVGNSSGRFSTASFITCAQIFRARLVPLPLISLLTGWS